MRYISISICLSLFLMGKINCQDYPMLGHTLVNSLLYNPSLAGADLDSKGSATLVMQESMLSVTDHPRLTMISGSIPFKEYKMGVGGNVLFEQINFIQQIYLNLAFSYHLQFNYIQRLSFGMSTDFTLLQADESKVISSDPSQVDPLLLDYENGNAYLDFSYGMNYHSKLLACGATVNNLRAIASPSKINPAQKGYYSGYLKFFIPINMHRDMLEPIITLRKLPVSPSVGSVGLNYSYRKINTLGIMKDGYISGGVSFDSNLSFGLTLSIQILKRLRVAYNYQAPGKYFNLLGSSHEIILSFNYLNLNYNEKTNEYYKWNGLKYLFRKK